MQLNVRRQGAVRSTTAMIVVGISEDGYREILGFKIALRETGESWKELKARGPPAGGACRQ
jgi:transposase-like protein